MTEFQPEMPELPGVNSIKEFEIEKAIVEVLKEKICNDIRNILAKAKNELSRQNIKLNPDHLDLVYSMAVIALNGMTDAIWEEEEGMTAEERLDALHKSFSVTISPMIAAGIEAAKRAAISKK